MRGGLLAVFMLIFAAGCRQAPPVALRGRTAGQIMPARQDVRLSPS